jgi:DNA-binding NtrC family response regulator
VHMASLLVVDDDLDMTDAFAEILRMEGHDVRIARNGREGLACLAEDVPDLILCDVEMPVLNGPDMAYQVILMNAGRERVPIVLTSGVAGLRRVAQNVGTPYLLSKPFTVEQLVDTLNRALVERRPPQPGLAAGP